MNLILQNSRDKKLLKFQLFFLEKKEKKKEKLTLFKNLVKF